MNAFWGVATFERKTDTDLNQISWINIIYNIHRQLCIKRETATPKAEPQLHLERLLTSSWCSYRILTRYNGQIHGTGRSL